MKLSPAPDLGKIPPFAGLSSSARQHLQAHLQKYDLPAGLTLVHPGQRGQFMAVIEQGQVEVTEAQGKSLLLGSGETLGEAMMRYGVPASYTAVTHSAVRLWVVQRKEWVFACELPPDEFEPAAPADTQPTRVQPGSTKTVPLIKAELAEKKPPKVQAASKGRRTSRRGRLVVAWLGMVALLVALAIYILSPELPQIASQAFVQRSLQAGRADLAEMFLEKAAARLPNPAALYDELGIQLYQQEQQEKALEAFEKAVASDAELASAQNNLGVALLDQGDIDGALEHLLVTVDLDPGNAEAYFNLGNAWQAQGDLQNAASAYRRAFELDAGQFDALAAWGGIAMQEGKIDAARLAWEQVATARPTHLVALRGLGAVALLQGQPEQALPYLLAARIADPQDAEVRFYLGMSLEALNKPVEAAESFELALAYSTDPALREMARAHLQGMQPYP